MNIRKRILSSLAILLALMIVIGNQTPVSAQEDKNASPKAGGIVGAWRTVVTPQDCVTGTPAPFSLRGLLTFHSGGTMSEWGVVPGSSPALRSPGHGVWTRGQGWQNYTYSFTHYLYDAAGAYIGRQKVAGSIVYDESGDGIATNARVEALNANDEVIASFCATSVGTRIE